MKITKIETRVLSAPLKRPFRTSLREVTALEDLVVLVYTDCGLVGYGEGAATPTITGETMGTMRAVIEYLSGFLIGRDIDEFDLLIDIIDSKILKNSSAKSALEIALYDIRSRSKNLPLYKMLGGKRVEFETDITISLGSIDSMVADSISAIDRGYSILKLKVGGSVEADIDRVETIYRSIDSSVTIRLDANQGWSPQESVEILTTLESRGVDMEFVEQPVKAYDIDGLKYIKDRIETPLLADESIFSVDDARRVLDMEAVDLINIKLAKCGGITNALKLADIASQYSIECMMGCMLEGPISVGAALHVASARADIITMLDLDAVNLCQTNPIDGGVVFDESKINIVDDIGLGISPNCAVRL